MNYLLLATVLAPLVGAILAEGSRARVRQVALAISLLTLAMAALLILSYPGGAADFALFDAAWFGGSGAAVDIRFSIGLDGLSLWLFGLTALLMVVAVLVSWEAIAERASTYYSLLLMLETGLMGVFVARDIILFYVFFEFTLIPLFFLIGIWGSQERRRAAIKFFLFTLAGSVLTFLGLLAIVLWDYYHSPTGYGSQHPVMTFSIAKLTASLKEYPMDGWLQVLVFLALFAGFAIKVPLFPLHTWLPLAHVEAPTAGSVILAGVLLKLGTYGFVRFALPMLPDGVVASMPWLLWLSVAGIIYGALVALGQTDIKRMIAYSSVSHMGFCMLGVFSIGSLGMQGGVLQMVNHGLSTGGLFALVGMIYERYHTRKIADLGGLAHRTPLLAAMMVVFTLSSIGLPGLNGFVGEFLILLGMFQRGFGAQGVAEASAGLVWQYRAIAVLAVAGVVLGAWYMLALVQKVFFGPLREPHGGRDSISSSSAGHPEVRDLSPREIAALAPLVVFIFWIGIQPRVFLDPMGPTLEKITKPALRAVSARSLAAGDQGSEPGRVGPDTRVQSSGSRVQGSEPGRVGPAAARDQGQATRGNDQGPMTNGRGLKPLIGHWALVIGHSFLSPSPLVPHPSPLQGANAC
jgi:NADH-quinone oxidoreductase subunit M